MTIWTAKFDYDPRDYRVARQHEYDHRRLPTDGFRQVQRRPVKHMGTSSSSPNVYDYHRRDLKYSVAVYHYFHYRRHVRLRRERLPPLRP